MRAHLQGVIWQTLVHSNLQLQRTRQNNIVVAGLIQSNNEFTDEQLFCELCWVEFNINPSVIKATRLEIRSKAVRVSHCWLFCRSRNRAQARLLLSLARFLRDSSDAYTVASSVFLSPHQTKAERNVNQHTKKTD